MSDGLIGVRIERNSPVLFVSADRAGRVPGDRVVVTLCSDDGTEREASVVISVEQLLSEPGVPPAGRIVRGA